MNDGNAARQQTTAPECNERMAIVVVGHVDHGKSTVLGRMLSDSGSLPQGKLEQVRDRCERAGKVFEYAFLLDALQDEQAQGITIDAARVFFHSQKRHYIVLDAPGHIEFLRNMVTGAARAEAALLVIDIVEGVRENSKRHGFMLSMLGIREVVVLLNKMDLADYSEARFQQVKTEYEQFLRGIGIEARAFIPISGYNGDNVVDRSVNMPWYSGAPVLETLDRIAKHSAAEDSRFRMPVQAVYKFTKFGDHRRLVAGTIQSGRLAVGDDLTFYPSGKRSVVKTLECFPQTALVSAEMGQVTGFTLREQVYVSRGELACRSSEERPKISRRIRVSLFWLGEQALQFDKEYIFKLGTNKVRAKLESIDKVFDASEMQIQQSLQHIPKNHIAECGLSLERDVAFDEIGELPGAGRFVLVDEWRISGGGIIREALDDDQTSIRERRLSRAQHWISGRIAAQDRAEHYEQTPRCLIVTGEARERRKSFARAIEARLFSEGRAVYFLGIGSLIHGLDADIKDRANIGQEHIRRLAELVNIMLDAGLLFIVSAASLSAGDLTMVRELVGADKVRCIWIGSPTKLAVDLQLSGEEQEADVAAAVALLQHIS